MKTVTLSLLSLPILLAATGCGSTCGPQNIKEEGDERGLERCRIIEGELIFELGDWDRLELTRLEEVTGRIVIQGVDEVRLPNLRQVGFDDGQGYVAITGRPSVIDLSSLVYIELDEERPYYDFTGGGLTMDAAEGAEVDISSLRVPGTLGLYDFGPTELDVSSITRMTGLSVSGVGGPLALDFSSLNQQDGDRWVNELRIFDTTALESVSFADTQAYLAQIQITDNEALLEVDLTPFRSASNSDGVGVVVKGNERLRALALDNAPAIGTLQVEDHPALESIRCAQTEIVEGTLTVQQNDALTDIAFPALAEANIVAFQFNPQLSQCDVQALEDQLDGNYFAFGSAGNLEEDCE